MCLCWSLCLLKSSRVEIRLWLTAVQQWNFRSSCHFKNVNIVQTSAVKNVTIWRSGTLYFDKVEVPMTSHLLNNSLCNQNSLQRKSRKPSFLSSAKARTRSSFTWLIWFNSIIPPLYHLDLDLLFSWLFPSNGHYFYISPVYL